MQYYKHILVHEWFCRFVQETGEPKSVQSAPLEAALSLESPPQELDVVQYMYCTCVQRILSIFAVVFGVSISSLAVFRPPTIPQHQHQEVAAPVQQSKEVETHEEELELVLCTKSCCVRDILHLECPVGSWYCRFVQETGEPKPVESAPLEEDAAVEPPPEELYRCGIEYVLRVCSDNVLCPFGASVFDISISSLPVSDFQQSHITHQEGDAPMNQSGEAQPVDWERAARREQHVRVLHVGATFVPICARFFHLESFGGTCKRGTF